MPTKNKSQAFRVTLDSFNPSDYIVIDIRSRGYYLISHIKDSINIQSLQRISFIAQENMDKKILLYCHSGATAAEFGDKLIALGCKNIYYLDENYFRVLKSGIAMEGNA